MFNHSFDAFNENVNSYINKEKGVSKLLTGSVDYQSSDVEGELRVRATFTIYSTEIFLRSPVMTI